MKSDRILKNAGLLNEASYDGQGLIGAVKHMAGEGMDGFEDTMAAFEDVMSSIEKSKEIDSSDFKRIMAAYGKVDSAFQALDRAVTKLARTIEY